MQRRGQNPLVLVLCCSLFESRKFGSVLLVGCETVTGWSSWTGTVQSTGPVNRLWLRVSSYAAAQIHCSLFAAYSSSSAIQLVYGISLSPFHFTVLQRCFHQIPPYHLSVCPALSKRDSVVILCVLAAGVGAGGHADDPLHSSRGDYAEHPDITLLQRPPHLVPAY